MKNSYKNSQILPNTYTKLYLKWPGEKAQTFLTLEVYSVLTQDPNSFPLKPSLDSHTVPDDSAVWQKQVRRSPLIATSELVVLTCFKMVVTSK